MNLTPAQTTKWMGVVLIGGIMATLMIFLVITWRQGDPTNGRESKQPEPAPASAPVLRPFSAAAPLTRALRDTTPCPRPETSTPW